MKKSFLYLVCIILLLTISSSTSYGNSIHKAVEEGDARKVSQLLDVNDKIINWRDGDFRETLIHYAVRAEHLDVVKVLVERGADINMGDNDELTPLHKSAYRGLTEISEYLISKGANISAEDRRGVTPLHLAAARGHNKVMELLLAKGAEINTADKDGETPLHRAAKNGYPRAIDFLAEKGADLNVPDNHGKTALYWTVERRRYTSIAALLRAGADTEIGIKRTEETPLHKALAENDIRAIEMLVKGGADVNMANSKGETPLQIAEKRKMKNAVKLLKEAESKCDQAGYNNDTGEK
jgi:ankyrin repeat protein